MLTSDLRMPFKTMLAIGGGVACLGATEFAVDLFQFFNETANGWEGGWDILTVDGAACRLICRVPPGSWPSLVMLIRRLITSFSLLTCHLRYAVLSALRIAVIQRGRPRSGHAVSLEKCWLTYYWRPFAAQAWSVRPLRSLCRSSRPVLSTVR